MRRTSLNSVLSSIFSIPFVSSFLAALFDIVADLEGLKPSIEESVKVEGDTQEELLVAWLDELPYLFYTKDVIFSEFRIEELSDKKLTAKAFGKSVSSNRNRLKTEIKAATYSGLKIDKSDNGYKVEIILDV